MDDLAPGDVALSVAALAMGRPVVLTQGTGSSGMLVLAAEDASPAAIAFIVRHTSGFLYAPVAPEICDRLDLPAMQAGGRDGFASRFTVSVDARDGVTTGISAHDRAKTLRLLAGPASRPDEFTRPGHIVPMRTETAAVIERREFAEAAVELCAVAGCAPAVVMAALVGGEQSVELASGALLADFARTHDLEFVSIDAVAEARLARQYDFVRRHATELTYDHGETDDHGELQAISYTETRSGRSFVAVAGAGPHARNPPGIQQSASGSPEVHIHELCWAGAASGMACDCGARLRQRLTDLVGTGRGMLVFGLDLVDPHLQGPERTAACIDPVIEAAIRFARAELH